MKRKISIFIATLFSVIMIVFVINSCKKSTLDSCTIFCIDSTKR